MRSAVEDGVKRPRRLGITFGGLSPSPPPRVELPQGVEPSGVPQPPTPQPAVASQYNIYSLCACVRARDGEVGIAPCGEVG